MHDILRFGKKVACLLALSTYLFSYFILVCTQLLPLLPHHTQSKASSSCLLLLCNLAVCCLEYFILLPTYILLLLIITFITTTHTNRLIHLYPFPHTSLQPLTLPFPPPPQKIPLQHQFHSPRKPAPKLQQARKKTNTTQQRAHQEIQS